MMKPQLVALALGLLLMSAGNALALAGDGTESCIIGHRFEPGPIVNGHNRQPTQAEVEARTQQLRAWNKISADSCLTPSMPRGSETIMSRSPGAASPDRVVELDLPSSKRIR
jgi:hypothetical protein